MQAFIETEMCHPCAPIKSSVGVHEAKRKQKNSEDMKQFALALTPRDLMSQKCETKECLNQGS